MAKVKKKKKQWRKTSKVNVSTYLPVTNLKYEWLFTLKLKLRYSSKVVYYKLLLFYF